MKRAQVACLTLGPGRVDQSRINPEPVAQRAKERAALVRVHCVVPLEDGARLCQPRGLALARQDRFAQIRDVARGRARHQPSTRIRNPAHQIGQK